MGVLCTEGDSHERSINLGGCGQGVSRMKQPSGKRIRRPCVVASEYGDSRETDGKKDPLRIEQPSGEMRGSTRGWTELHHNEAKGGRCPRWTPNPSGNGRRERPQRDEDFMRWVVGEHESGGGVGTSVIDDDMPAYWR